MPELTVVESRALPQFDPTPEEARTLAEIRNRESSGDYTARNPKPGSTASGAYQFTSSSVSPTWQLATKATGAPVYSSAAEAPQIIQDANALHMLRKYGPNSTITWAASGPYKQTGTRTRTETAAPTDQPASNDVLSRIATGDVAPDELARYLEPEKSAPAAPETPKPEPAAALTVVESRPLPPPPPTASDEALRLARIGAGASGLTAAKNVLAGGAKVAMDFLVGNPVNPQDVRQFNTALLGLEHGIYGELPRSGQQLVESLKAFGRGDINSAADHLWFSIPFLGAAGQGMAEYLNRGDIKGALAHAAGSLVPVAGEPAISATKAAIEAAPEAASRTVQATGAGIRAAAPDVALGTAKAGAGYAVGEMLPHGGGPLKYVVEFPTIYKGAKQVGRGLQKGVEAARASWAETGAPAAAAPEAGAGLAVPKEAPITGPTDEALVHLYSVETDPAKRSALQAELVNRGLMKEPSTTAATVAPEANPYRDYSQNALQRVYALEQDATKRALIEQAARDRNLSLLTREGRRATAAVPETGAPEARGPSLTQDDALMLRYLGETDPLAADAETIGIARKLAADNPELLNRLRATGGATQPIVSQPTPAEQATITQPATAQAEGTLEYNAPVAAETAPPAPATVAKTPGQVYAESQGENWAKLSAKNRQLMEHFAQAQANAAEAELELATRPTPPRKPPTTPPAAPQAAPAAPEAPAATPEPAAAPVEPGAPQTQVPAAVNEWANRHPILAGPKVAAYELANRRSAASIENFGKEFKDLTDIQREAIDSQLEREVATEQARARITQTQVPAASVEKLTDYVISKKIAPHMVDKLPAEYWQMIADDAGVAVPTADEIAQIKANVAAKAVPETPPQGEQMFQEKKAAAEEGMTPPKETPPPAAPPAGGVMMEPLPENIPPHYLEHYAKEGLTVTQRDFAKDLRVADYVLGKGISPEEFAAKSLAEQNKLILEAPTKSGKGKHFAYVENPKPGEGRPAAKGIRHIVDTMRWRQAQTAAKGNP